MKKSGFLFSVFVWMSGETQKKIYLFTWENAYSLTKELKRWKDWFAEKNGSESIFLFNRENWDYGQIKQTIFSGGFFVTNKLVILEWIPLDTEKFNVIKSDEIEKLAEDIMNYSIPSEVLLVCISYKPDKRSRFYKRLSSNVTVKSFSLLNERELPVFVSQEWKDLNLTGIVVDALIKKVWNDQFRLASEIDKLRYRKQYYKKEITSEIIDEVCFWLLDEDVFKILDLALTKPEIAVKSIQSMQKSGIDWNALNGSFAWWLRNYLFVLDYADSWITDSKQIASELKQNPWVIMNITKKIKVLKEKRKLIQTLFESIVDIDYDIKSGNAQPESYFFTIKKVLLQN